MRHRSAAAERNAAAMIRLLIVDDEMLVLVGIQSMLDWAALGIEIVGTAHNGTEALAKINTLRPDIVLIDINMPVKNGLEVAKECREKYGRLPLFIFLTSYEEFSFAREAVAVQALDYLVKIFLTPEQLRATMTKAIAAVHELKPEGLPSAGNSEAGAGASSTARAEDFFQDRFFLQLFNGFFKSPSQCREKAGELGITDDADYYAVIICRTIIDANRGTRRNSSKEAASRLYASTLQTAKETVVKYCPCAVTGIDMQHFAITLFAHGMQDELKTLCSTLLSKLREVTFSYFSVDLTCTVGIPVSSLMDIPLSYRSAESLPQSDSDPIIYAGNDKKTQHKEHIIEAIETYIRNNITKKLSLNDVAEEFDLSATYLSQLFAKTGGTGFVEYVTQEKVAAAKRIIKDNNDIRIYELAEMLGFDSAFYFSTVFKKVAGCTPSEYRDSVQ